MNAAVMAMYEKTVLCRVSTSLIPNVAVDALTHLGYELAYSTWLDIKNIQVEARMIGYDYSLSYAGEDGWRILPNSLIIPFATELRQTKIKFTAKMAEIAAAIDTVAVDKPDNASRMRALVSGNSLAYKFRGHYDTQFSSLPEKLSQALHHSMLEEQIIIVTAALTDATARFIPPLEHFIDRIGKLIDRNTAIQNGQQVGRMGTLRDTAVTNVQTLVSRAEDFNFANDPFLAETRERLLPLMGNTPEELRVQSNDVLSGYRDVARAALDYLVGTSSATPAGENVAA